MNISNHNWKSISCDIQHEWILDNVGDFTKSLPKNHFSPYIPNLKPFAKEMKDFFTAINTPKPKTEYNNKKIGFYSRKCEIDKI